MPRLDAYAGFSLKASIFNPFSEVIAPPQPKPVPVLTALPPASASALQEEEEEQVHAEEPQPKDPFSFFTQTQRQPEAKPKPTPLDQPRGKNGERLLYTHPTPLIQVGSHEYQLLVGSSDRSASAYLMQFDGAANPNPGPASSGAVLWSPKDANGYRSPIIDMGKFLGKATNNIAEIQGLLLGLKVAAMRGARDLLIEGDSELIIRQQTREYKVSNKNLKSWWAEIQAAMMDESSFDWIAIRHVRREFNERADSITKEVLSKREGFTRC